MIRILLLVLWISSAFAGEISTPDEFVKFVIKEAQSNRDIERFLDLKKLTENKTIPIAKSL